MWKNIIKVKHEGDVIEIVVRKTMLYVVALVLCYLCLLLVWLLGVYSYSNVTIFADQGTLTLLLAVLLSVYFLGITAVFIVYLVRYFYNMYIINSSRIVAVTFWVCFVNHVSVIDIYRVLSVSIEKSWFWRAIRNYGNVKMEISSSTFTTMKKMKSVKNPHVVAKVIESMKESAIKERIDQTLDNKWE